jgi:hypothetical protein
MAVDFLIIGAQKGGSTWLYDNIRLHPSVFTPKNELHFFSSDENYAKGDGWYHSFFPSTEKYTVCGEKTPEYLTVIPTQNIKTNPQTHQRIFSYNTDMKLIAVLREPVSRLRSAVNHMYRTRRVSPFVTIRDLLFGKHKSRGEAFSLLENGLYYENLARYLEVFPAAQLKVFFFETDVLNRPMETLESVCDFLKIPFCGSCFSGAVQKKNEYQMSKPALVLNSIFPFLRFFNNRLNHVFPPYKAKIDPDTLLLLKEYYGPANDKLRSLGYPVPESWNYQQ